MLGYVHARREKHTVVIVQDIRRNGRVARQDTKTTRGICNSMVGSVNDRATPFGQFDAVLIHERASHVPRPADANAVSVIDC